MRWDHVLKAVTQHGSADAVMIALFGVNAVRMKGDNEYRDRGVDVRLVNDGLREIDEPCVVQFDVWGATATELAAGCRLVRDLFHHEFGVTIDGVTLIHSIYLDGSELGTATMGPDRGNVFGRALRFQMVPVREDQIAGRSA